MKSLKNQLLALPGSVLAILAIVLSLLVSAALIYLIALPNFQNLSQLSTEIATEKAKAAAIDQSIASLKSQDKDVLDALEKFLKTYVPGEIDNLHFATLNEAVSNAAGVTVNNIQISSGAKSTTAAPPTATTKPAKAAPAPPTQAAAVSIAVTYSSNFDSLLRLISYWQMADQLVGVKGLDISGVSGSNINYTINYDLPTSPLVAKAVVEDHLVFTKAQMEKLQKLQDSVIYTATPSAQSVGKSDPFK